MSPDPTAGALLGQVLGKRYLVRRLIGSGGMGAVYEVEHLVTKRIGALKLLHPRYASVPEVVARFVMEASAAGRIDNPHVVQTFDAGELESGEPYMFMELLAGTPMSALIQSRGRLPFDEARELVLQAASGLSFAHAAGIVHRDVKPENLFVCHGDSPFVKVLDFGISKFTRAEGDPRLTTEGAPLGTPYYMSPEQVVGQRDLDQRTDIYSLGVVLYECVTGDVPFKAETLPALGIRISQGQHVPASELVPELPRELDAVIARAMALDANDRFPDMPAFAAALAALGSAPAVSLAPTLVIDSSVSGRVGKPSVRRGVWLPLALLGVLAALALAVFQASRTGARDAALGADGPTSGTTGRALLREPVPAAERSASTLPAPAATSASTGPTRGAGAGAAGAEAAPPRVKAAAVRKPSANASRAEKDGLGVKNPF
ncbi:MAG TPA: serine/threonine-protein kinase [Polyangiaceae bacterium]|nr:serine/threonine-protein kinase [Polyangiaceae bacterium]